MKKSLKKNIFGFKIHRVYLAIVVSLSLLEVLFSYILKIDTVGIIGFVLSVFVIAGVVIFFVLDNKKERIVVLIGIVVALIVWFIGASQLALAEDVANKSEDFRNLGDELLFTPFTRTEVDEAWDLVNSQNLSFNNASIGIMDTGVDLIGERHPEFRSVPIFPTSPRLVTDSEEEGHGTQVTGIVGANNISFPDPANYVFPHMNGVISGIHGLNYLLYLGKKPTIFDIGSSVDDLAKNNVGVINMSFSTRIRQLLAFPLYKNFFTRAFTRNPDILFIAAAGNTEFEVLGIDVDGINAELVLPAALGDNLSNVVTVGATIGIGILGEVDSRTSFSNFGDAVNLAAPGDLVYAPAPRGRGNFPSNVLQEDKSWDSFFAGTSASAPMVTGVAGILKALEPEYQKTISSLVMNPATIKNTLVKSADPISPDKSLGSGCFGFDSSVHNGCRLNAHRAVAWWLPPGAVELNEPSGVTTDSIELSWATSADFNLKTPDFTRFEVLRSTSQFSEYNPDLVVVFTTDIIQTTFTDTGLSPGTEYFYRVFTVDGAGLKSTSNQVSATTVATNPPAPVSINIFPNFSDNSIAVRWGRSPDVDFASYDILRNSQSIFTTDDQNTVWYKDTPPASLLSYQAEVENEAGLTSLSSAVTGRKFASNEVISSIPGIPEPGDTSFPSDVAVPYSVFNFAKLDCPRSPTFGCIGPFTKLSTALDQFGHVIKQRNFDIILNNLHLGGVNNLQVKMHRQDVMRLNINAVDRNYQVFIPAFGLGRTITQEDTKSVVAQMFISGSFDIIVQSDTQSRIAGTIEVLL